MKWLTRAGDVGSHPPSLAHTHGSLVPCQLVTRDAGVHELSAEWISYVTDDVIVVANFSSEFHFGGFVGERWRGDVEKCIQDVRRSFTNTCNRCIGNEIRAEKYFCFPACLTLKQLFSNSRLLHLRTTCNSKKQRFSNSVLFWETNRFWSFKNEDDN